MVGYDTDCDSDRDIFIGISIETALFQISHLGGDGKCLFAGHLSECSKFSMTGWSLSRESPKTKMLPVKAMSGIARGVEGWNRISVSVGKNGLAKRRISFGTFLSKRKVRFLYRMEHIVLKERDHIDEPQKENTFFKCRSNRFSVTFRPMTRLCLSNAFK